MLSYLCDVADIMFVSQKLSYLQAGSKDVRGLLLVSDHHLRHVVYAGTSSGPLCRLIEVSEETQIQRIRKLATLLLRV